MDIGHMRATSPSRRPSRRCNSARIRANPMCAWRNAASRITRDLARFVEAQTSIFLATANAEGLPYIQDRGGPPGFLTVLDDKTLGFADFAGNQLLRELSLTNINLQGNSFLFTQNPLPNPFFPGTLRHHV